MQIFKLLFFVFEDSKASEAENKAAIQKWIDLSRNFLENVTPFAMLALGVAVTVPDPSSKAVLAVQTFTVSRILHNILFIAYPYQPFRAFSFVPQVMANVVLCFELLSQLSPK